ncbi:hypothetical protein [Bradyrhizobium sp. SEMIA]|uniref:hypothetical protein n=1 Tax=Bradyrhizobium sp. SEMIA TaxID=2597515 RepID=UPI0018A68770|nr:hypothetical protein [Bradyrhizobium sp. SEMIA]QOG22923.1 hypothetical protein FOM02_42320 [Bradyrhizobium sp. SEMIA]
MIVGQDEANCPAAATAQPMITLVASQRFDEPRAQDFSAKAFDWDLPGKATDIGRRAIN